MQRRGQSEQGLVADGVAEGVVDPLCVVELYQRDGVRRRDVRGTALEASPVEQPRQRVCLGGRLQDVAVCGHGELVSDHRQHGGRQGIELYRAPPTALTESLASKVDVEDAGG